MKGEALSRAGRKATSAMLTFNTVREQRCSSPQIRSNV